MKIYDGYLKAVGKSIQNGKGETLLLRGVGLGNWLLPEGYMWKFYKPLADRPRRIEALISDLIGEEAAQRFWNVYHERYITEADVARVADEGFDSIRLPINWRVVMDVNSGEFIEEGFAHIQRLVDWCKAHDLYVILDLHGAPGGQTGANIDDSEADHPELFRNEKFRRWNIEIWRELARRYVDEPIVAAYDLLNEPLPEHFREYNPVLADVYREVTAAIREIDTNHIIMYEGAHWATDFSMINQPLPENIVIQFHKYWNNPDTESIRRYLDKRDELDVPLYMGESGENSNDWYAAAFQLYEDHGAGWNFWCWKKLGATSSPCSINPPANWNKLTHYVETEKDKPSRAEAQTILDEYLDNILFDNCEYHSAVVDALLRRVPFKINAEFYGYRGSGVSYEGANGRGTEIGLRSGDSIVIEHAYPRGNGDVESELSEEEKRQAEDLCILLRNGEWVTYEFNLRDEAPIGVTIRAQTEDGQPAKLDVAIDGRETATVAPNSGDWATQEITTPPLKAGRHVLRVRAAEGVGRVDWLHFAPAPKSTSVVA
jgi:hypothetical protein